MLAMSFNDHPVVFRHGDDELVGVVSLPEIVGETGLLVIVGGPQYRAGSHRQFVALCRCLAGNGVAAMRFDMRGMGDSSGEARSFECIDDDIGAAIDAFFTRVPSLKRVVLWGLCAGASASLLYWERRRDERLAGLCLVNPWIRSEQTLARATLRHYYRRRLFEGAFWKKLFAARLQPRRVLSDLLDNLGRSTRSPSGGEGEFQATMAEALCHFDGRVLVILSGNDMTGREFAEACRSQPRWAAVARRENVRMCEIANADHTFSSAGWREQAETLTLEWLSAP
ncbi:MAG: hydrolase 1, exosortase A system-associated [Betaproteobacteria bacterium]